MAVFGVKLELSASKLGKLRLRSQTVANGHCVARDRLYRMPAPPKRDVFDLCRPLNFEKVRTEYYSHASALQLLKQAQAF
ncbi:hypothetical protein, partial [Mesorhizobium sp. M7A.F.Ca.ET.027.03.2.1]|uniref:hypothetical protein n=1 Tax=Mesorhizobium sp. M7A.F.Ca.ET.027.03.2.1 TaxID=2496656 RepID=UPI001FDFA6B7